MRSGDLYSFLLLLSLTLYSVHLYQVQSLRLSSFPTEPFSPFSIALKTLQSDINYTFENDQLLGRAMTHASYSEENNKALSILGSGVIESSMVLQLVGKNFDISAKDLNHRISEFSKEASCAADGMRLRLEKVIRVSSKTNSSAPGVVCGAYRAIFGAVALDSESLDIAGRVFLGIWEDRVGKAMAIVPKWRKFIVFCIAMFIMPAACMFIYFLYVIYSFLRIIVHIRRHNLNVKFYFQQHNVR